MSSEEKNTTTEQPRSPRWLVGVRAVSMAEWSKADEWLSGNARMLGLSAADRELLGLPAEPPPSTYLIDRIVRAIRRDDRLLAGQERGPYVRGPEFVRWNAERRSVEYAALVENLRRHPAIVALPSAVITHRYCEMTEDRELRVPATHEVKVPARLLPHAEGLVTRLLSLLVHGRGSMRDIEDLQAYVDVKNRRRRPMTERSKKGGKTIRPGRRPRAQKDWQGNLVSCFEEFAVLPFPDPFKTVKTILRRMMQKSGTPPPAAFVTAAAAIRDATALDDIPGGRDRDAIEAAMVEVRRLYTPPKSKRVKIPAELRKPGMEETQRAYVAAKSKGKAEISYGHGAGRAGAVQTVTAAARFAGAFGEEMKEGKYAQRRNRRDEARRGLHKR